MNQPHRRATAPLAATAAAALLLSGCSGKSHSPASGAGAKSNFSADQVTTPAAKGDVDALTWYGDYRAPYSLDPLKTADYPEETILGNVCESLLRTDADYSLAPGLAKSWKQPDGTHLVFDLDPAARFSDGKPVTADDVVYSLKRNQNPDVASNYADSYAIVSDISASSPSQVTVTLSTPNHVFVHDMGILAGAIVEKANTEAQGQNFGAAGSPVVCSGPFAVDSFDGTNSLVLKKNANYWDPAHAAKAGKITFQFIQDPAALATGLDQGTVQGAFNLPVSAIGTLQKSAAGKLYIGGAGSTTQNIDLIVSNLNGTLGDARVRQALSLVIDREGVAKTLFSGAADPLYAVAGPGFWAGAPADAKAVYQAGYDKLKVTPDVAKAKALIDQAGAKGKSMTIAYAAGAPTSSQLAAVLQQAGQSIGLDVKIVGLPDQQYGSLFTDEKARAGYDSFITINYLEFPEAAAMYASYATKDGVQNFNGYADPVVEDAIAQAQGAEDPVQRAQLVVKAQDKIAQDLPWIPIVQPRALLFQNKGTTGAPLTFSYMSGAWAAAVGAP